ncbi:MAG: hypothetical protein NTV34_08365 [Proteobacteria bacterium]|nr:hypothetical protein [Pseudomonadota bacterium]
MTRIGVFLIFVMQAVFSEDVLACASCGSGGDDPLVLFPNESWKAYAGFARVGDLEGVDSQGEPVKEYGPQVRNVTTISLGKSFHPRAFGTVTAPYIVNRRESQEQKGWGDLLTALRWTIVQQSLASEWLPQIQLLSAYRTGYAPSVFDYQDPAKLDVRGSGVPEARAGFDVWNGMSAWKAGFAQTVGVPLASRQTDFGYYRPGVNYRSTATVGYGWSDTGKMSVGVTRDQTTQASLDSVMSASSEVLQHGLFVTGDERIERATALRITWSRAASLFVNRNTNRSQTVTVAVIRSF